jgi:hypothetical protein
VGEKDFHRHRSIKARVPRFVHLAHAPGADQGQEFIGAETGAGGEGQTLAVDYTGRASAPTGLLLCDGVGFSFLGTARPAARRLARSRIRCQLGPRWFAGRST